LRGKLAKTPAEEQALLSRALRPATRGAVAGPKGSEDIAPGIQLRVSGQGRSARYTLSGPGLSRNFKARLAEWLKSPV